MFEPSQMERACKLRKRCGAELGIEQFKHAAKAGGKAKVGGKAKAGPHPRSCLSI